MLEKLLPRLAISLISLQLLSVAKADNRLHDFTHVQVIEQNLVPDKADPHQKDIRIDQLVAYKTMYDSEIQGLVCVGWVYTGELIGVYHIDGSAYAIELRSGALIIADILYQSVTYYDVEQANRKIYHYYNDPSMKPVQFQRRSFYWNSFVLPQGEENPSDMLQNITLPL